MTDPTTSNRGLIIPSHGADVDSWDSPLNNNFTVIDQLFGSILSIATTGGMTTLSSSQAQNAVLRISGALVANASIVLPAVQAMYVVENLTTNANYYVQFSLNGVSGQVIAVPQGKTTSIFTDGTNVKFLHPSDPATYWDYGGAAAPVWIAACTVRPWLSCDGTVYNISDYPYLGAILGSSWGGNGLTTFAVPELRNKVRVSLKSSSPLITSAISGMDGSAFGSSSTSEGVVLDATKIPVHNHTGTSNAAGAHTHFAIASTPPSATTVDSTHAAAAFTAWGSEFSYQLTNSTTIANVGLTSTAPDHTHPFTTDNTGGGQEHTSVQPTAVAGMTFIKT